MTMMFDKTKFKIKRGAKPTPRQIRAVRNMVENGGIASRAMIDAGYSPATAKNPSKLTDSKGYEAIQTDLIPLGIKLEQELHRIMETAKTKDLNKEEYRTLVEAFNKFNLSNRLISDKSTENTAVQIKWKE